MPCSVRDHLGNRQVFRAAMIVLAIILSGCAAIPGGTVPIDTQPEKGWTETQLRETFGAPDWVKPGSEGFKIFYFDYITAPQSKALAVATAITTFGLITDSGSVNLELVAIVDQRGHVVCSDRAHIPGSSEFACEHELRLANLDALPPRERSVYNSMLRKVYPKQYVRGHYQVVQAPAITDDQIAAAISAGADQEYTPDKIYFFNAECYLLTRWYAKHIEADLRDATSAREAAARYAKGVYEAGGTRGLTQAEIDDDISIYVRELRTNLDAGRTTPWARRSETCIASTTASYWKSGVILSGMGLTDFRIADRVAERIELAQILAAIDLGAPAEKPPNFYGLYEPPMLTVDGKETAVNALEERKALENAITLDAIAAPLDTYEAVFAEMLRNGTTPPRQFVRKLTRALEARIAIGDHAGAVKVIANIGRFYIAQSPDVKSVSQGAQFLFQAAGLADFLGDHNTAASLALMAGEVYRQSAGLILAENGLASEEARETVREIINFVPYSYVRTEWDGSRTRYTVDAPMFRSDEFLRILTSVTAKHVSAGHALGYAASIYLPPAKAGRYFADLAREANKDFSSYGASRYYLLASRAYETAGRNLQANEMAFYGHINDVVSESGDRSGRKRACSGYRLWRHNYFDVDFANPDPAQVTTLFGKEMSDKMRKYDRTCDVE